MSTLLLSPITAGDGLQFANRVVMAPMTRARAGKSRVPNEPMATWYNPQEGGYIDWQDFTHSSSDA